MQPAFGDQAEDSAQAGRGIFRRCVPQVPDAEVNDREVAGDQPVALCGRGSVAVSMSGAAAASCDGTSSGTGTAKPARTSTTSARPPPLVNAATLWPAVRPVTPGPISRTVPDTSRPGAYGQA